MMVVHGYIDAAHTMISATIDGILMQIPNDTRNGRRQKIAEWEEQGNTIPAYQPEPVTLGSLPAVSHAQIIAALIVAEIITETEGVNWIKGTLPDDVEAAIALLPAEQRTIATLRAIRPSEVTPSDPLVGALAAAKGKTDAEMITLFQLAASL